MNSSVCVYKNVFKILLLKKNYLHIKYINHDSYNFYININYINVIIIIVTIIITYDFFFLNTIIIQLLFNLFTYTFAHLFVLSLF